MNAKQLDHFHVPLLPDHSLLILQEKTVIGTDIEPAMILFGQLGAWRVASVVWSDVDRRPVLR